MTRRVRSPLPTALTLWVVTAVGVAAWAIPTNVSAQTETIERVVAVVNTEAIFLSQVRQRAAPMLGQVMTLPSSTERMAAADQLYQQVLDRMVVQELYSQEAERMELTVTRVEVDRAIERVRRQAGLSEDEFWQAVTAQGFTRTGYRADVRRQLLRLKVINNRARNRVRITEPQVRERYEMMVARARRTARFSAAHIFLEVPEGVSATELSQIRARANRTHRAINSVEDFEAQMEEVGGGELTNLTQGSLASSLEQALLGLDEGEFSEPVRGPTGYYIFLLRERDQVATDVPAYEDVQGQIFQEMTATAMQRQEEILLTEMRQRAIIDVRL